MPGFDDHHGRPGFGGSGFPRWHGDGWSPMPGLIAAAVLIGVLVLVGAVLLLASHRRATAALDDGGHRARWRDAVERHDRTARAFAAYECDPTAVLARPALSDVTQPTTARFVDAFAEACALRTDEDPGPATAGRFGRAAEAAERAWLAAVDAADRIRTARFAPGERTLLDQAVKLLTTAGSSDNDAERHAAYRRARQRLAELERRTGWALPRAAAAELEHRARGVLTAAG